MAGVVAFGVSVQQMPGVVRPFRLQEQREGMNSF